MIVRKCAHMSGIADRKQTINHKNNLSMVQKYNALTGHLTTIYRETKPVKQQQLSLMKLIDRIHI